MLDLAYNLIDGNGEVAVKSGDLIFFPDWLWIENAATVHKLHEILTESLDRLIEPPLRKTWCKWRTKESAE